MIGLGVFDVCVLLIVVVLDQIGVVQYYCMIIDGVFEEELIVVLI